MGANQRSLRARLITLFVGLAIVSGGFGATGARASNDWIERINSLSADWLGTDRVTPEVLPSTGRFEPDEGAGLGPADYISWNIVSPDGGSHSVVVLLVDQPIASVFRLEGRELVGRSWTFSSRDVATSTVATSDDIATTQPNTLACAVGVAAASGAAGARACFPVGGGTGGVLCGIVTSVGGGMIGFFVCQDPDDESVRVSRIDCRVTYCDIEVEVLTKVHVSRVKLDVYWDTAPQADWVVGALPCRPACGSHSITSPILPDTWTATYSIPDPDNPPAIRDLYKYVATGRAYGAPTCFRDNTKAVWIFARVERMNGSVRYGEGANTKPSQYCPY